MAVYSIDIVINATAYIRADSEEEARKIASQMAEDSYEMRTGEIGDGVEISDADFDSDDLPDVSISPAMTCAGPPADAVVECVRDDD